MSLAAPEIVIVGPFHEAALARFFAILVQHGVDRWFHPHPFTPEMATQRALYRGLDLYVVVLDREEVIAYGMLRGWDEGYDVPSLGIAVHPASFRQGLGGVLMNFLHLAARRRGAQRIRLKVDPMNKGAVHLYESLGYVLTQDKDSHNLVGYLAIY